jgi:hypothetical protein
LSIAPGLATWLAIAVVDLWARPGQVPAALTTPAMAAFFWVSTAGWAASVPAGQYVGGGAWFIALIMVASTHGIAPLRQTFAAAGDGWIASARAASSAWLFPLLLLADPSSHRTQAIVVVGALAVLSAGLMFICRADARLQDSL